MVNGRTNGVIRQLVGVFREGTLAGLSDRGVLRRFVDDRDEAAFEALLSRQGAMVLNVCRQILRDPDDAEDAFQATFLVLACKAGSLRIGESLGPWLYRVASHVAARARADRRRRGDRERSGGSIPEPEPDRDDRSDRDEVPWVVHEDVGRLPERLRAPIVLCYLEGMTHARAAERLRCPVGTVRSRLARALLHGRIARCGLVTAPLGAMLVPDAGASRVPPRISLSLVKATTRITTGTACLRDGCGIPGRVAALLEGVLNVLRVEQIAGSMAGLAVIGVAAAIVGLSVFPASGWTDDSPGSRGTAAQGRIVPRLPADTIVKTSYVGDLIASDAIPLEVRKKRANDPDAGQRALRQMTPLMELIASTVVKGTWSLGEGRMRINPRGRLVELEDGEARPTTVGVMTPFCASNSLIIRHTRETHEEVANLLRMLRRLEHSREHPEDARSYDGEIEEERLFDISRPPARPAPPAAPDRAVHIRRRLDELRQEVEKLPRG